MSKNLNIAVGAVIGWLTLWLVFTLVNYLFYLANASTEMFSTAGIVVNIIILLITLLPFWLLRKKHPGLAKGLLIGVILTVMVILLLSLFSSI
jgi:hypothetical protein